MASKVAELTQLRAEWWFLGPGKSVQGQRDSGQREQSVFSRREKFPGGLLCSMVMTINRNAMTNSLKEQISDVFTTQNKYESL